MHAKEILGLFTLRNIHFLLCRGIFALLWAVIRPSVYFRIVAHMHMDGKGVWHIYTCSLKKSHGHAQSRMENIVKLRWIYHYKNIKMGFQIFKRTILT